MKNQKTIHRIKEIRVPPFKKNFIRKTHKFHLRNLLSKAFGKFVTKHNVKNKIMTKFKFISLLQYHQL